MIQTLDQRRAAFAWECATSGVQYKEYKVLAKSAPALIMNSGLMPALAFYYHKEKNKDEAKQTSRELAARHLIDDLIRGLYLCVDNHKLERNQGSKSFGKFMQKLQGVRAQDYLRYTDESLELLKWIRQFVDAV
jgi:CRISPR-associated protein Cmr5